MFMLRLPPRHNTSSHREVHPACQACGHSPKLGHHFWYHNSSVYTSTQGAKSFLETLMLAVSRAKDHLTGSTNSLRHQILVI